MPSLADKNQNAIEAVTQLIALLERCSETGWASRLYPVLDALQELDYDQAIKLWKNIPMPNMGGFLDLILCVENGHKIRDYESDNKLLQQLIGCTSRSLGNLRVFLQYQLDRELINVPTGS